MRVPKELLVSAAAQYSDARQKRNEELVLKEEQRKLACVEMFDRCASAEVRTLLNEYTLYTENEQRIIFYDGTPTKIKKDVFSISRFGLEHSSTDAPDRSIITPVEAAAIFSEFECGDPFEETFWRKITDIVDNIRVINSCST